VKLANYGSKEQNVTISIPETSSGRLEMLSGPQFQGNQPYQMEIETATTKVHSEHGTYSVTMNPWAVAVLAVS
jgi:alpha-N-arabinofuranosidase